MFCVILYFSILGKTHLELHKILDNANKEVCKSFTLAPYC